MSKQLQATRWIGLTFLLGILLAACATAQPAADPKTQLVGKTWVLVSYGDPAAPTAAITGVKATSIFSADGKLNGFGSCNNYNSSYKLDGTTLTVGQIASTMMACEQPVMDQETIFLSALQKATRVNLTSNGQLEIFYNGLKGEAKLLYNAG
jgi:heat shock protein HslJ